MTSEDNSWKSPNFRRSIVEKIDEVLQGSEILRNSVNIENQIFRKAKTREEYFDLIGRVIKRVTELKFKMANGRRTGSGTQVPINTTQNIANQIRTNNQTIGVGVSNAQMSQALTSNLPQIYNQIPVQQLESFFGRMGDQLPGQMQGIQGFLQMQSHIQYELLNQLETSLFHQQPLQLQNSLGLLRSFFGYNDLQNEIQISLRRMAHLQSQIHVRAAMIPPSMLTAINSQINSHVNRQTQQDPIIHQISNQFLQQMHARNLTDARIIVPPDISPFIEYRNPIMTQSNQPPEQMQVRDTMDTIWEQSDIDVSAEFTNSAQFLPQYSIQNVQFLDTMSQLSNHQIYAQNLENIQSGVDDFTIFRNPNLMQIPTQEIQLPSKIGGSLPVASKPIKDSQQLFPTNCSIGITASPSSENLAESESNQYDEQVYKDKVLQLSKYIELLKKMIIRMDNNGETSENLSIMNKLLESLINQNKYISLETLLKCEAVLEKVDARSEESNEISSTVALLEAITNHLNNSDANRKLQSTFESSRKTVFESDVKLLAKRKKRQIWPSIEIPEILRYEIAQLDSRFRISMRDLVQPESPNLELICHFYDKYLPCAPPIFVIVPKGYPEKSPVCYMCSHDYNGTQFLINVKMILLSRIEQMPQQFSFTQLLSTWEMSIRQSSTSGLLMSSDSICLRL